ncbi:S-adenosyl-L-methionine-dependent methyltransferase [Dipodascopsis tothii]|uniref:S-adenosyl-L-methionine-dependent methyltransferase n=1 Tax=Dipodascopsis tothii TaxID=44089 RepID=UPI0034CD22C1
MPRYLIYAAAQHESFKRAELAALAELEGVPVDLADCREETPFCYVDLVDDAAAARLVRRSILARAVYAVWAAGPTMDAVRAELRAKPELCVPFRDASFRFDVVSYQGSSSRAQQRELMESFGFMDLQGPIRMKGADHVFAIFEDFHFLEKSHAPAAKRLRSAAFGRLVAESDRAAVDKYDLKKRAYIGTTSFDAELSLVCANIAQVAPGKLVYDPFVGTGSFLVAASHFGGTAIGSDIDGRQIRGKKNATIAGNYAQYGLGAFFQDIFACDFTHNPLRPSLRLDAIICDPPYGVREGLKVLGARNPQKLSEMLATVDSGDKSHLLPDYIPPKKPYHFDALLIDLVEFSAVHLVDNGRMCCWIPVSNDDYRDVDIPTHPDLEIVANCVQVFSKWSRRLVAYRRKPRAETAGAEVAPAAGFSRPQTAAILGTEQFRDKYFRGFRPADGPAAPGAGPGAG